MKYRKKNIRRRRKQEDEEEDERKKDQKGREYKTKAKDKIKEEEIGRKSKRRINMNMNRIVYRISKVSINRKLLIVNDNNLEQQLDFQKKKEADQFNRHWGGGRIKTRITKAIKDNVEKTGEKGKNQKD